MQDMKYYDEILNETAFRMLKLATILSLLAIGFSIEIRLSFVSWL